jgi:hypothetical protein
MRWGWFELCTYAVIDDGVGGRSGDDGDDDGVADVDNGVYDVLRLEACMLRVSKKISTEEHTPMWFMV